MECQSYDWIDLVKFTEAGPAAEREREIILRTMFGEMWGTVIDISTVKLQAN